jgi:hypothetical protein
MSRQFNLNDPKSRAEFLAVLQGRAPLEQGREFKKLRDQGMRILEISRKTGISESTIRRRLALLE